MRAEIISVGNELLAGTVVNTNSVFLARQLALMGFEVHRQSVVGDEECEIVEAVTVAAGRSHVVVLTGGLGPTKDDITKESVVKAFRLQLEHSPEVEKSIREHFRKRGQEMPENNLKQANVIKGSEVLHNTQGTAPGLYLQTTTQAIVMLPGPPSEMELIFENEVRPRLAGMSDAYTTSMSLHTFGIGESALEEKIGDLLYGSNPTAALYAKRGEVNIDLVARADSPDGAQKILAKKVADIEYRIGDYIYSKDGLSLHETVVNLLKKTRTKIAVAESCTGGMMAAHITEIEDASKIFDFGVAAYSDSIKQNSLDINSMIIRKYTSISSATASEMAKGARIKGDADIGVGITGLAGPKSDYVNKPVGLIYIAIADKRRVIVKKFNFGSKRSRTFLREIAVLNAFDMVRRFVSGLEIEGARIFGDDDLADYERKGKPHKKSRLAAQKAMSVMLAILVALSGTFYGYRAVQTRVNQSVYNELRNVYRSSGEGVSGLNVLATRNSDTVGWIEIGDSTVDSVVVTGRDDYYENHDFKGSPNSLGCLYVDPEIDLSCEPDNTVIYGTSSSSSMMFGPLLKFNDISYLGRNYSVKFDNLYAEGEYRIMSVLYANSNPEMGDVQGFYKTSQFGTNEDFIDFVIEAKMRSIFNIESVVVSGDKFITLVTDAPDWDGAKLVVIARQVREGEWSDMTPAMFSKNVVAAYPDKWYELTGTMPNYNEAIERDGWLNWLIANERSLGRQPESSTTNGGLLTQGDKRDRYVSTNAKGETVITVFMNGAEIEDTPTTIVSRIVAKELGPDPEHDEAVKALAVAVVTHIKYCYNTVGVPEVSGISAWEQPSEHLVELVSRVVDEAIYYDGEIAFTPYFSGVPSKTYSGADVWGLKLPYLQNVDSKDNVSDNKPRVYTKDLLKQKLEAYYSIKLSDDHKNWIKIIETGEGGVVKKVSIDGKIETTGMDLSGSCLKLNSPNFTMEWGDKVATFYTQGIGHGVGLSEMGAMHLASQGWSYEDILEYYYEGISVKSMRW